MKLRIDTSRSYALALEGGGAKGAYQIGAWKALREAGVKIDAVAGTSVGALNGSLIVMGDLEKAENIWENIRYSQVMDVDDETMSRLLKGDVKLDELDGVAQQMFEVIKNRGFDVTPLRKWISQVVDEKTVRKSPVELFIDTFSLSDGKLLELRAKDLPEGTLCDMLLASAISRCSAAKSSAASATPTAVCAMCCRCTCSLSMATRTFSRCGCSESAWSAR